jgi:hypothetical protein
MEYQLIKAIRKQAEADLEEALLTLQLLTENPAGIGEHTSGHFLEEGKRALHKLGEAEDLLETIERHFGHQ